VNKLNAYGYFFTDVGQALSRKEFEITPPESGEVIVKVHGCGLCHTDLSFYTGAVGTKMQTPLVLGHEISGVVVSACSEMENLIDKKVIIPAVLPCGDCELCLAGRDNICQNQKMPGNDFHGGFASHIKVPGRFLCVVAEELGEFKLEELSVVADAITTPYQSLKRSKAKKGDLAIVLGTGGIGIYMVQHLKNIGATVIACDVSDQKLESAKMFGASFAINVKGLAPRDLKKKVREIVKENSLPNFGWKVFETSGTGAGQMSAFSLLSFAGVVGIIGFTMDKLELRLSNLMAFDGDLFGNWGCSPKYYPDVVKGVLSGEIKLKENIEIFPLDKINEVIALSLEHKLEKRAIFVP
jgi:6-hydroxycyclohex-1-ene-1-carbonyl-CoA dehydrogenase